MRANSQSSKTFYTFLSRRRFLVIIRFALVLVTFNCASPINRLIVNLAIKPSRLKRETARKTLSKCP